MKPFRALALLLLLAFSAQAQTPNNGQGQFPMRQSQSVTIASDQSPLPISGMITGIADNYSITQTIVTCTTTSSQLIGTNLLRKALKWTNTGANDGWVTPGSASAVATVGMPYQAQALNKQGSAESWEHGSPTNSFQCITASGTTTFTVWEGQ